MAIFRSIFCGVFCALMFCGAGFGASDQACSLIKNFKGNSSVKSFIDKDVITCHKSGREGFDYEVTPLEHAFENLNLEAFRAILQAKPSLAQSKDHTGKTSILERIVAECAGNKRYRNKEIPREKIKLEMVKLLVQNGANVDTVSTGYYNKTMLDMVRYQDRRDGNDENYDWTHCNDIEKVLLDNHAKTYAELSGQTKSNSAPATSATQTSVPQTQSPETAKTVNTEQTVKTNVAEPVNAQASVASIDNDGSNKTDAVATAVGDAVAVSTTITPQSEKGNTTEKDSEVKVEQVPEKEEISSDAEESPAGSDADNKGGATIDAAAVQGRIASVHDGVIQQNINPMKVIECRACAGNYSVICRDKKVGDECVYETKCRYPDWKLFNDGQWDAYCEEPPQLGASMVQPRNVPCSEEESNSINAVKGTKNSEGICEPVICKIDYEIKGNKCVKQECTDAQLNDLNAASGFIENEVCIPKDCLTNFKLVGGKCVDAAELEKQMQDAESAYDDALTRETSLGNRLVSAGAMAATGIGGMELARGLAEKKADEKAEADMAAYMETFQCKIGDMGDKINGGDMDITTPGANQLINLYQSYVDLAASVKTRKADLGLRPGIEAEVVLDKSATGLYDDKGNGVQNGTYASLYRAAMGNQTDIDKLAEQSDATTRRVGIGGTVAGAGAVGGAVGNVLINKDSVDSDSNVLNQAAGLFLGK
ncbi:MAG: hypothetical protein ACLRFM_03505 [Alphaproteobacteria bacterium]